VREYDLIEKRSELLQIIIGAILIAMAINILSDAITGQICVHSTFELCLIILAIFAILFSVLWLSNTYLGKFIAEKILVVLLLNRETGEIIPLNYSPALTASLVLEHVFRQEPQIPKKLAEELPKRSDPLIRDLIEILIVGWLSMSSQVVMTPNGRIVSLPITPSVSKVKSLQIIDVLKKFGDNALLKAIDDPAKVFIPHAEVYIPYGTTIIASRYEPKGLEISIGIKDETGFKPIFTRIMRGEPGGSELMLRGSRFNPLKAFVIRTFVERISDGATMFLRLSGYTPLSISKDKIVCSEKIIENEELERLRKWIEIDCVFLIGFKMRGWLFWHPGFAEWYRWGKAMLIHAKRYFDFSQYLEHRRFIKRE